MIRRKPSTDKLQADVEPQADNQNVQSIQATVKFSDLATPFTTDSATEQAEPSPPPEIRISEGGFRQIRDESLVLLSQGISHRIKHSEEGPFQIFVERDKRRAAQFQIRLYHRENPPRDENPPLPLKLTLHPRWVLAVPVLCTLLDFSDICNDYIISQKFCALL